MPIQLFIKYSVGLILLLSSACALQAPTLQNISASSTATPVPSNIVPLPRASTVPISSPQQPIPIMSQSAAPTTSPSPNISPSPLVSTSTTTMFQGGGGGGSYIPPSAEPQNSEFRIDNIFLSHSGASVMGRNAPVSLSPDYEASTPLKFIVQGYFPNIPVLNLEQMHFTHEPGLLHLNFSPGELPHYLVLNQSIVLKPISVSSTQITATLHPQGLPDLYLKGLHTLTLKIGSQTAERQIKVGDPLRSVNLNPIIHSVIYNDVQHPTHIKLTGLHFMLKPSLNYVQMDGVAIQATQVSVQQTESGLQSSLWIPIPNPDSFDPNSSHELLCITSFGAAFTHF